jgi:hypothetical protein
LLFAVIQQQAISFAAVTASPAHKGIDFYPLLWCDFQYHRFRLLSVFRAAKKPPSVTSTAQ